MVLRPHGKSHRHAAVYADDHQQEDAAEHVEEHDEGGELTHDQAEYPLSHHQVRDTKGQAGTEDEVRDGQAQVPGGVHRFVHLEAGDPNHDSIAAEAQYEDDDVDDNECNADNRIKTPCDG